MEMTITRALAELKLLEKRINDKTVNARFIGSAKKSDTRIDGRQKQEFEVDAKATYDSILDLVTRRKAIKCAIVASNANTIVTINGVSMPVADAIERKSSIAYEQNLLTIMRQQYNKAVATVNQKNDEMQKSIDGLLLTAFGKDASKVDKTQIDAVSGPYKEINETMLVDPLNLKKKIDELADSVDGFLSEVDYTLSESNCITKIVVPD